MVVKAKRETRKFERLKFWITVTLKWIIKKDKTEETNIFTTWKVLLCNSKEWGICVSKKDGGFEGMQRAHGRFERPGKDIATIAKTIWTRTTAITRYTILWLWGQKSQAMSKYKSYNKKPIVKYIHNKIFLFIMMFSSFKVNNCIDLFFSKLEQNRSSLTIFLLKRALLLVLAREKWILSFRQNIWRENQASQLGKPLK